MRSTRLLLIPAIVGAFVLVSAGSASAESVSQRCEALLKNHDQWAHDANAQEFSRVLEAREATYEVCSSSGVDLRLYAESVDRYASALPSKQQAESVYREAMRRIRLEGGPDHPALFVVMYGLASVLDETGRHQEALEQENKALHIAQTGFGEASAETSKALVALGWLYQNRDEAATAERYYRKAIDAAKKACAPRCDALVVAYAALFDLVKNQPGREAEAAALDEAVQAAIPHPPTP